MRDDEVSQDEILYRAVQERYVKREADRVRPTSMAFTDKQFRVSVDRAALCNNDPNHTKVDPSDLVVRFAAGDVRRIASVAQRDSNGEVVLKHLVRVEPEPLPDNPAHAVIFADPQVANPRVFQKLREALARLAEWESGFAPGENA